MKVGNAQRQTIGKGNFTKYLNPSSLIQPKANRNRLQVSNMHCRSMQELDFNAHAASYSSMTKQGQKTHIHHSSLFCDKEGNRIDGENGKSKSLSKFITFFENSNLLNPGQVKKEIKETKRNNYNGFSYDLKISANSNLANNKKLLKKKDKQNINYQTVSSQQQLQTINSNKTALMARNDNCSPKKNTGNQSQEILLAKMKQVIDEQKKRQAKYCDKIDQLEQKNKELSSENQKLLSQTQIFTKKITHYEEKIKELEAKCRQIHEKNKHLAISHKQNKGSSKQSRQQDMVVKSLKKVINEQLNKIIELERFKIQNDYLKEKLGPEYDHSMFDSSFSNHEYSFDYEHKEEKKSPSSLSSSFKPESQILDYAKQHFRKSKPSNIGNKIEGESNQNHKPTHFKSFFQIEQSPISADDKMKRFFKISETPSEHGKKDSNKNYESKDGSNMIKIIEAESSFSRDAIEQVNEENDMNELHGLSLKNQIRKGDKYQNNEIREAEDSILQEVDEYLTKWRGKP